MTTEDAFKVSGSIHSYMDKSKCDCRSIRKILKLISQILIPLMIGIFTLVIALQQHKLNKENRKNDLSTSYSTISIR
jgi:hypothetical protein